MNGIHLTPEHEGQLRYFGKYFGYPQCCIDFFIEGVQNLPLLKANHDVAQNGFVPCNAHAELIRSKTNQLTDFIKDREAEEPFESL